jgi:hypothetical protein
VDFKRNNNQLKILSCSQVVKGKIAFENSPGFQAQIEDLPLKGCILGKNPKTIFPLKIDLSPDHSYIASSLSLYHVKEPVRV